MSHRPLQLAGIIRSVVALYASRIPPNTAVAVSIVEVQVSRDLTYADLYLGAIDGLERAIRHLEQIKGEIRSELARRIQTHRLPLLRYHRDVYGERAGRVDDLLAKIEKAEQEKKMERMKKTRIVKKTTIRTVTKKRGKKK